MNPKESYLRESLIKYLLANGKEELQFQPIEVRILQLSPLQITDDYFTYLEVNSLEEKILQSIDDFPGASYKLILNNWNFVFKRVPNTHEYYFDIVSEDYRVLETGKILELEDFPEKLVDDAEVK
jgi:hypothetical protein